MKLNKTLYVNDAPYKLQSEDVVLSLYSPGRAVFQVIADHPLSGTVRFEMGYSVQDEAVAFFNGVIRESVTVDSGQQRLRCRELSCVLYAQLPAALRHPTLRDVVQWYAEQTGLTFIVPERDYAVRRIPSFYTLGDGYQGICSLGALFRVPDYVWFQQGDGSIFVGSWQDSRWAARPVELDEKWFTNVKAAGGKSVPAIPELRPGVLLNGQYLTKVKFEGHEMVVTCEKALKK